MSVHPLRADDQYRDASRSLWIYADHTRSYPDDRHHLRRVWPLGRPSCVPCGWRHC